MRSSPCVTNLALTKAMGLVAVAVACLAPLLLPGPLGAAAPPPTTVPLYRMVQSGTGAVEHMVHFYTTNAVERESAKKALAYKDEGVACYVLPQAVTPKPGVIVPFYRLSKPAAFKKGAPVAGSQFGSHLYTADAGELARATADGWTRDGVECLIAPTKLPGTSPLYRFHKAYHYPKEYVGHTYFWDEFFYTADEKEYFATLHGGSLQYDGIAGYVWTKAVAVPEAARPSFTVRRKPK